MIIFIIHSNHSFLSIYGNGEIVADQINQVANAMENPTSFRPWKPNCQMTPNQEDIIGGRSSVSDSTQSNSGHFRGGAVLKISGQGRGGGRLASLLDMQLIVKKFGVDSVGSTVRYEVMKL